MSLDVLRSIQKSNGRTIRCLFSDIRKKVLAASGVASLEPSVTRLSKQSRHIAHFIKLSQVESVDFHLKSGRDFAFSLAKIYQAALLSRFYITA